VDWTDFNLVKVCSLLDILHHLIVLALGHLLGFFDLLLFQRLAGKVWHFWHLQALHFQVRFEFV
jgi:hypothetical protein